MLFAKYTQVSLDSPSPPEDHPFCHNPPRYGTTGTPTLLRSAYPNLQSRSPSPSITFFQISHHAVSPIASFHLQPPFSSHLSVSPPFKLENFWLRDTLSHSLNFILFYFIFFEFHRRVRSPTMVQSPIAHICLRNIDCSL